MHAAVPQVISPLAFSLMTTLTFVIFSLYLLIMFFAAGSLIAHTGLKLAVQPIMILNSQLLLHRPDAEIISVRCRDGLSGAGGPAQCMLGKHFTNRAIAPAREKRFVFYSYFCNVGPTCNFQTY